MHLRSPSPPLLSLLALLSACGPKRADETAGDPGSTAATAGTTGASETTPSPETSETPTTAAPTSEAQTTGDPTAGDPPPTPAGVCPPGWEFPGGHVLDLHLGVPDVEVVEAFDPGAVYPDDTPAVCVLWDGEATAGVRLALGPAVGAAPQSLLEIVVTDGERSYGTDSLPPPTGAYDGISVRYTVTTAAGAETYDFAVDQGIGVVGVSWVPRRVGEHILLSGKLTVPHGDHAAKIGFDVDLIVGLAVDPTPEFCEGLDTAVKCAHTTCGGWLEALRVTAVDTCASELVGLCVADFLARTDAAYDSAFFRVVDDGVLLARVGGEACTFHGDAHPATWTECGAGPGDPPECACACAGGTCPGDAGLALLEGCALPKPCADIEGIDAWDDAEDCFYQALGAGATAALRVHHGFGEPDLDDRVYLRGDGSAAWLRGACSFECAGSCDDRDWGLPRSCTLKPPAFFADCAASLDPDALAACRDVSAWFEGCVAAAPACP